MATTAYELLEQIGQGGMGTVYRARHRITGRLVAVKIMKPEAAANPRLRTRFGQEFLAASRLHHPNIVRSLSCDLQGEQPRLVMELVEGRSLGERLSREGPLSEDEALRVIHQVADGLAAAHRMNLIHRDVKPDNILLAADGVARLTDLGLVKDLTLDSALTNGRTGMGTAAYAAPEQAENARCADVRSDIYGLGATLYHALAGVAPFRERVRAVLLKKQMLNEFRRLSHLVPTIHPAVDRAVSRALDGDPENRQQSCQEFIDSLGRTSVATPATARVAAPEPAAVEEETGQGDERRRARRFPCETPIVCGAGWDRTEWVPGHVQDISVSGVLLRLPRRFEPGSLLTGEILDAEGEPILHLVLKVHWVRKAKGARHALGCAFDREINAEEVYRMLGNAEPTTTTPAPLTPRAPTVH